jgi:hypothetical protein
MAAPSLDFKDLVVLITGAGGGIVSDRKRRRKRERENA